MHKGTESFIGDSTIHRMPLANRDMYDLLRLVPDSFFSTKPHGLGVGLPIVRSIVERFRGQVLAENGPEGGAVFRVILPATSSAA